MEFNEFKKMNLHASTQLTDHVTRREAASVVGEYVASDPVTNRCAGIFGIFTPKNASFWKQNNCKVFLHTFLKYFSSHNKLLNIPEVNYVYKYIYMCVMFCFFFLVIR